MPRIVLIVALVSAIALPMIAGDWEATWRALTPVIHANIEDKAAAMRTAPIIVVARIEAVDLFPTPRQVLMRPEVGGPMVPIIDL